ncbi:MAG: hypothetical protein ACYTXE_45765 [Nostoc sp.]
MKLYATSIPQTLPSWATVISNNAGLIEIEINDEDPRFHSIIEELSTEIDNQHIPKLKSHEIHNCIC